MSSSLPDLIPDVEPETEHAMFGKIARLPADLREQLNQRILDGEKGSQILAWVNELPVVKEVLAAQFGDRPIQSQNLSNWRANGFQRWLRRRENLNSVTDLNQFAAELIRAGVGSLTPAALGLASGKLLEYLEAIDPAKTAPADLARCAAAIALLREKEQNDARIQISQMRLRQHDMALRLKRDKQQRDTVAVALHVLGDARAKAIEGSSWSNAEKFEALGIHLFGPLWEPRPVPTPAPPSQPPNPQPQKI